MYIFCSPIFISDRDFDFEAVFIPNFDDESDELVMAIIKGSVIKMIDFIQCLLKLFKII